MRICFFCVNISHTGGTERVSSIIANNLAKEGHEVYMMSLVKCEGPAFKLEDGINTIYLENGSGDNKKNFIPIVRELKKINKKYKFDLLVEVDVILRIFTVLATKRTKTRVISWEHFNFRTNLGTKLRDIARKIAARTSDYIVTLTEEDKEDYEKSLKCKAKVKAISNPLVFYPNEYSNLNNKVVLSVGRMHTQKGFDMLIEAWAKVKKQDNEWKLRIAGDGDEFEKVKNKAVELQVEDSVEFLGLINNVAEEYLDASIYVMSSRFEGFPMVLLEAMSFGLPVVSFDCHTGPRDIIKQNEDGLLVSPNDTNKLANQLIKLMKDDELRHDMGRNAKENIKRFSIDNIIKEWNEILNTLK
ncbi:glycosyltransferase family 4 protein [Inconstantimicrobium mannanitabidum]|uniref:Glycosyltransferase n=1 Tax=Inconstantimicrobium mannanitabidum TaxID=1604901 RepID=A0ACB5RG69_9CLOT|nr:glycosyltransferase family 4 protein [Clostridium sp. TW13]GKX68075.1 putative glycosyltransferase [Clostridium sp. TW13]